MLGLGYALLIIGYAMGYTAVLNLKNGGKGPKLLETLGFTGVLKVDENVPQGSSNQTGQPASQANPPASTGVWV